MKNGKLASQVLKEVIELTWGREKNLGRESVRVIAKTIYEV